MPTQTAVTANRGRPSSDVDPHKWRVLFDEMLAANGVEPENAARPNGPVPVSAPTIRKWRKAQGGVTADMVRDVCRAMNYPVARALVAVGWLAPEELGISGLAPLRLPPVVQHALDPLAKRINTMLTDPRFEEAWPEARKLFAAAYDVVVAKRRRRPPRES